MTVMPSSGRRWVAGGVADIVAGILRRPASPMQGDAMRGSDFYASGKMATSPN
jgi:hypothetical protein